MRHASLLASLLVALSTTAIGQQDITQADLFRRVIDLDRLTQPPAVGERTGMFSSAPPLSEHGKRTNTDDYRGNFRKTIDGWHVMADIKGPGAITRIWYAQPNDLIRITLDGENVTEMPFETLLSGNHPPFEEPLVSNGTLSNVPMGFSSHCQVLCKDASACYQINYARFPDGTHVQRFTMSLDEAATTALNEVKRTLTRGMNKDQVFAGRRTMPVAVQQDLATDEVLSETVEGAGTIRALYVALTDTKDPRELYALHRCVLRIFFDGEETPSVEAPLTDFFGAGFEPVAFRSLAIGTSKQLDLPLPFRRAGHDRFMYCHFPMPFHDGVRVEITNHNHSKRKIGFLLHFRVDLKPPAEDALRFNARYRNTNPCRTKTFTTCEATGPGRLVGCLLNIDYPHRDWWGIGGERIAIDTGRKPNWLGTGINHYFGHTDNLPDTRGPLAGVTRTGPFGKTSAYRWHIADAVTFHRSLRFDLATNQLAAYKDAYVGALAYWYADPKRAQPRAEWHVTDLDLPGLRIPGAIEAEYCILSPRWGSVVREENYPGVEFSGGRAANITTHKPIEIFLTSPADQTVTLKLRTNPRRGFGTISVKTADGGSIGTVSYVATATGEYTVGTIKLKRGDNAIFVECDDNVILDCWILEPLPNESKE